MSPPIHTSGDRSNILQLPVQSRRLDTARAAHFLGISPLRMRMLGWLGGGPANVSPGSFQLTALEDYERTQYLKIDLPAEEMARRRKMRTSDTSRAVPDEDGRSKETFDPLMMAMTRLDLQRLAILFALKTLAIFALIMVCLSITPVMYVHAD